MGDPKSFVNAFDFRIEIGGEVFGYAWNAGPFKDTVNTIEIPGAGGNMRDVPGNRKMAPFTVELPLTKEAIGRRMYEMYKETVDASTGTGTNEPELYKDIDFVQLDREGNDVDITRVYDSVAVDYERTKMDKKENDKRREIITFTGGRFDILDA